MKHVRRLTAMTLVLAFVFLLSTSAFASRVDGNRHEHGDIEVYTWLTGGDYSVSAAMKFMNPENINYSFSASMVITYTYCPEDAMRPLYYVTETESKTYTKNGNGEEIYLTTPEIPDGCVLIEVTCTFEATITTPSGTYHCVPDDLTIYLT